MRDGIYMYWCTLTHSATREAIGGLGRIGSSVRLGRSVRLGSSVRLGRAVRLGSSVRLGRSVRLGSPLKLGSCTWILLSMGKVVSQTLCITAHYIHGNLCSSLLVGEPLSIKGCVHIYNTVLTSCNNLPIIFQSTRPFAVYQHTLQLD